jgi:hypothetical protein
MLLTAAVTKHELVALLDTLTPLRIVADERRGRAVTLGRPHTFELVAGRGVRIGGDARIDWDVAGVAIPVTIQRWQVLLVPRMTTRARGAHTSRVLAFEPVIEELDLKLVPGFLDDKIKSLVRDGIAHNQKRLAWDFARVLSQRLPLPAKLAPARTFELAAVDAAVEITAAELRVTVSFEARVERAVTGAVAPHQRVAAAEGRVAPTKRVPRRAAPPARAVVR